MTVAWWKSKDKLFNSLLWSFEGSLSPNLVSLVWIINNTRHKFEVNYFFPSKIVSCSFGFYYLERKNVKMIFDLLFIYLFIYLFDEDLANKLSDPIKNIILLFSKPRSIVLEPYFRANCCNWWFVSTFFELIFYSSKFRYHSNKRVLSWVFGFNIPPTFRQEF